MVHLQVLCARVKIVILLHKVASGESCGVGLSGLVNGLHRPGEHLKSPNSLALATSAAGGCASSPLCPAGPFAEILNVTAVWAFSHFLEICRGAFQSAVGWVYENFAKSLSLTVAPATLTPVLPFPEDAVKWFWSTAGSSSAFFNLGQMAFATKAAMVGLLQNFATSESLSTTAGGTAGLPGLPFAEDAIHCRSCDASRWRIFVFSRIAWGDLLQTSQAEETLAMAVACNFSLPHGHARAASRARVPIRPGGKEAVFTSVAWNVEAAEGDFFVVSDGRQAAAICHPLNLPPPVLLTSCASPSARCPVFPITPQTVYANLTALSKVAGQNLMHVSFPTWSTSLSWHSVDLSGSLHDAATTGLGAARPARPCAPLAVFVTIVVGAGPVLSQVEPAARTTRLAQADDCTMALLMT
mmetsp:Transcript_104306/g.185438  ORF Transcript_104306/g.185438 Transcript_104306/m.185438 type:complete len:412 (+) Transcript_104306:362-1597(+)